ncbi:MAG TPA: GAF domain-containing protein [Deltaproteobacteria bacterium]|nr:GAF domain-containing protein [Deltaproteobacteria bacterium]
MQKNPETIRNSVNQTSDSGTEEGIKLLQAQMLLNVSKTVAAFETLDEMLAALVDMTASAVDADRCTIFLHNSETGELYSRVAHGDLHREIRVLSNRGVAGHVFTTGIGVIVHDAYANPNFDRSVDQRTGYQTKNILCVPVRTVRGEIIGVAQALNKKEGLFTENDLILLEAMTTQAAVAIQSTQLIEQIKKAALQETEFFDVIADVTSEIDLSAILGKVMSQATKMLNAERSTLFLNDEKTDELFSQVGEGLGVIEIRVPNHLGIAGTVFTSGETVNIPYAYADLRFNPAFDKKTGFFTRSILCVPVVNKAGKKIGVTQVLNKRGGPFTREDESRLNAFTAQVSIALENAKLFDDIQNMKNYSEAMLESMSNGVITLDEDGKIITCNSAGLRIMQVSSENILGLPYEEYFAGANAWISEKIKRVEETHVTDVTMDAEMESSEKKMSVNLTVLPLLGFKQKELGSMIIMDDITTEKRMKSTMSRYMDPGLADQVLDDGENFLGGRSTTATVLFSDIRDFTTLTEEIGAQGTVSLLNEYFTLMVDCVQNEAGMLDKFIGDAMMAAFGIPIPRDDDEDRAVRAAIAMINALNIWNKNRINDGKKAIEIGIGINTDLVVSGNIGSQKRMDYTMIGDGVNLAARLESACKQYFAKILISENTYRKLRGTYRSREIDWVVVKGKSQPVGIYEILDYHTDETFPHLMEAVNNFKNGLTMYREGKWNQAIEAFQETLNINPNDRLPGIYIERCAHLKKNQMENNWDGIWIMKSK